MIGKYARIKGATNDMEIIKEIEIQKLIELLREN